jgi:hypothetical protein
MSLFGIPTADELQDLLSAKDYTVAQVQSAYTANAVPWSMRDGKAFADWTLDWNNFLRRYTAAHLTASTALGNIHGISLSLVPVGPAYQGILDALSPGGNVSAKGSLYDLTTRLGKAGINVDVSHTPQPQGHDIDLGLSNLAGIAVRPLDNAGQWVQQQGQAIEKEAQKHALLLGLSVLGIGFVGYKILTR